MREKTETREGQEKPEAETGMVQPQSMECLQPGKRGRKGKAFHPRTFAESIAYSTP